MTGLPGAMIMNCPGVFFTPVSSYFGVPKAEFTLYFSIINITAMVYLPLCGKIMDRVNLLFFLRASRTSSCLLSRQFGCSTLPGLF